VSTGILAEMSLCDNGGWELSAMGSARTGQQANVLVSQIHPIGVMKYLAFVFTLLLTTSAAMADGGPAREGAKLVASYGAPLDQLG
jgi:hypothetical protein